MGATKGRSSNTTIRRHRWPITSRPQAAVDYEREVYVSPFKDNPEDDEEFVGRVDGRPHRYD